MVSSKITELLKNLPENVIIEPTAEKDLAKILKNNFGEFKQIFSDLIRLGHHTLPPAGRKKLRTFDAWQFDAGRFRVIYHSRLNKFFILAIFAKSVQKHRFRSMR